MAAVLRPESVTLHLDQQPFISSPTGDDNIKDVAAAVTADETGGWKASWQGLSYNETLYGWPKEKPYLVREKALEDYTGSIAQTGAGLRASLIWADGVNEKDKPESITATLVSETGDSTSRTAALNAANKPAADPDGRGTGAGDTNRRVVASARTGDGSHMALWSGAGILSLAATVLLPAVRRRRKED